MRSRKSLFLSFIFACWSCGSGSGPYGFARRYVPLPEEEPLLKRSAFATLEDVRRLRPEEQPFISWFGVVVEPPQNEGVKTRVRLSLRAHQERHLCSDENESSCRVTVSERSMGHVTAIFHARPQDLLPGPERLGIGSLLRIYGRATGEIDSMGDPVIQVEFYRHWPRHTYVTTQMAARMRR
ncbi:MAG: hypothetical protein N2515_02260 [Deltaproteobacteria bacterium]|nr:hypothetical protein [Deltaproteobacteria bacterium]